MNKDQETTLNSIHYRCNEALINCHEAIQCIDGIRNLLYTIQELVDSPNNEIPISSPPIKQPVLKMPCRRGAMKMLSELYKFFGTEPINEYLYNLKHFVSIRDVKSIRDNLKNLAWKNLISIKILEKRKEADFNCVSDVMAPWYVECEILPAGEHMAKTVV